MSPHDPLADATPAARRAAVAIAALVLVGALGIALASGTAAADDHIERDGSDLVVNVSDVDGADTVVVTVTDPSDAGIVYRANATDTSDGTVPIDVTEPDEGTVNGVDLTNATVDITVERSGENASDTRLVNESRVPLHAVEFDDDRPAWFDVGGEDRSTRLRVPLDTNGTSGIDGQTTIDLDLNGNGTEDTTAYITATQLTVDRGALIDNAGSSQKTATLNVLTDMGPVIDDPTVEPELRSTRDGFALWHPLFDPGAAYAVEASAVGESARYTEAAATPDSRGYLDLSAVPTGNTTVRVTTEDGTALVNATDAPLVYDGSPALSATVADDGSLRVDRSLAGLTVDGAVTGSDGDRRYAAVDATVNEDGRLALNGVNVEHGETLLLSTAAGEVIVTAERSGAGGTGGGIAAILPLFIVFLAPTIVGVVTGILLGRRADDTLDMISMAALGVFGFGLTAFAALAVLWFFAPRILELDLINIVGYLGIAFGTAGTLGGHRLSSSSSGGATADTVVARVTVTDGSDLFRGDVSVYYRKPDGPERYDPVMVQGGPERIQMPGGGTWEVYARHGSAQSNVAEVDASDPSATLTLPVETTVTVVDAGNGEPIPDATIDGEEEISGTTDRNGTVTIDPPEDATDATIEIRHERYTDVTERVSFRQGASPTVELERRMGHLRVSASVDGAPVGPVSLRITPDDAFLRDRLGAETVTTDPDGNLDDREVPIGEYRVESALSDRGELFEATGTSVEVRESRTATAEVDATFAWRLDAARKDRLDAVRADVRSLSEGGGRDGTIPWYYASVVEALLDVAASVPDAGHEFVGREVGPDETVDGILAAAERATDAISEAMTTKRNVDLFAACSDMPAADVEWSGAVNLAELLDRLESESGASRREVKQRYEAVEELVEDRRGELSEVAPAREMQQRAWEMTRAADRGPEAVAVGYTSLLLLDAVEELFEHDALRERLTRTVF